MRETGLPRPAVTVASVIERDGRFLLVLEETRYGPRLNQPAGHLESGETLPAGAVRETLEETGHRFEPEQVVGFYLWHSREADTTYLRVAFCGEAEPSADVAVLDEGVVAVHWLMRSQLVSRAHQLRSPMVLRCIDDYLVGQRFPLDCLAYLASTPINPDETATLLIGC